MELLLFLLAILFSIFSALMERRRRRREHEEAQQQHTEIEQQYAEVDPAAPVVVEKEKEEEPTFGWPFDGDPFEEPVVAEVDPAEAEQEALEAERQALEAERRAVAAEKLAMERLDGGQASRIQTRNVGLVALGTVGFSPLRRRATRLSIWKSSASLRANERSGKVV